MPDKLRTKNKHFTVSAAIPRPDFYDFWHNCIQSYRGELLTPDTRNRLLGEITGFFEGAIASGLIGHRLADSISKVFTENFTTS